MSYKTEFQANNTDLRGLIDAVNNLPVHENLDAELTVQDAKIAELQEILARKAAGTGTTVEEGKKYTFILREGESMTCTDGSGVIVEPTAQAGTAYVYTLPYWNAFTFNYNKAGVESSETIYVSPETEKTASTYDSLCPYFETKDAAWAAGIDWSKPAKHIDELYVRDPYIILVDDIYILYCSNVISPVLGNMGYSAYVSADTENWIGPYDLTAGTGVDWSGYEHFWTPVVVGNGRNVNKVSDFFYMMAVCKEKKPEGEDESIKHYHGIVGFEAFSPLGPFYINSGKNSEPRGYGKDGYFMTDVSARNCLTPHFWVDSLGHRIAVYEEAHGTDDPETSQPDIIYTQNLGVNSNGKMYFSSDPFQLFSADNVIASPSTDNCTAPFLLPKQHTQHQEIMLFNTIINGDRQIGQAYSESGFAGPWNMHASSLVVGDVGGACVFPSRTGKMMLAYHVNNTPDYENGIVEHLRCVEIAVAYDGTIPRLYIKS